MFTGAELRINPVYRSSLLYWACYLDEDIFKWKELREMIQDIEPYPEWRCKIDGDKTALHVTAIKGFEKKMRIILLDLNKRYPNEAKDEEKNKYDTDKIKQSLLSKLKSHKISASIKFFKKLEKR